MILLLIFLVLMVLGIPIAVVIGMTSIVGLQMNGVNIQMVAQRMFSGVDSFTLMSIPFFIYAGDLMLKGGTSKRLVKFSNTAFGWITGGVSVTAVMSCLFFSALSGSSPATVAGVGSIMFPNMVDNKYPKRFSAGIIIAAGSLGIVLPPSITMLAYGVVAQQSIADLFLASVIPGLFIALVLLIVAVVYSKVKKLPTNDRPTLLELGKDFWSAFASILMPILILGSIYLGVATVTEAAAVSIIYSFVVGKFIYKELNWSDLLPTTAKSVRMTAIIMFVIATTDIFGWFLTFQQVPTTLAEAMLSVTTNPILMLIIINLLLLLVGMVINPSAAVLILTPLLLPVVTSIGVDPIHFGVIMICNLSIGFSTPPAGLNLFVMQGISKMGITEIIQGTMPFIFLRVATLMVITFVPWMSLALIN